METLEPNANPAKKSWAEPKIVLINQNKIGGGALPAYNENTLVTKSVKGTAVYFTNGKTGINNHTRHFYIS